MAEPIRVLGIPGSLRAKSFNRAALRAAGELMAPAGQLEIYDLAPLPFYHADVEAAEGFPPAVQSFRAAIEAADAVLIATPEYYYSIPGVLKNAIEWAMRPPPPAPLDRKPVGVLGVTPAPYGTTRAQAQLRYILLHSDARVLGQPETMIGGAPDKFDAENNLVDPAARDAIQKLVEALLAWTRRFADER
jgi:chromate reductase